MDTTATHVTTQIDGRCANKDRWRHIFFDEIYLLEAAPTFTHRKIQMLAGDSL